VNPRIRVSICAGIATFLGSLSLLPVFDSFGWMPRVLLIIAVITLTSILVQRVRFLAPIGPLVMAAVGLIALTILYARQVAPWGFFPGPAVLRSLHATMSSGFNDTTELSAPVPVTRGLSLLTTGGIGIVALVVEALATGLRRPAVAGLPLLAIFTVPAAILSHGVGWQPFVFAAIGYLALLLAEGRDRISRWGRPVRQAAPIPLGAPALRAVPARTTLRPPPSSRRGGSSTAGGGLAIAQLTQAGRRVGAIAIGVAVIVPVVIPGLHSGWFGTHRSGTGTGIGIGGSGSDSISPIVSLKRDLTLSKPEPLFTYTTTAATPDYLRLLSLDTFDGNEWTASSVTSPEDTRTTLGIQPLSGVTIAPTSVTHTDVSVSSVLHESYLPVPALPTDIKVHGDWLFNPVAADVYSLSGDTARLNYQVSSDVLSPTTTFLNSVVESPADPVVAQYSRAPSDVPSSIVETANAIVTAAHAQTAYQKAVALQDFFTTNFVYDVSTAPGEGYSALLSFLNDRRGYCEQFAATMALMARIEGIPARVDVGFTPGVREGSSNTYQVTTADAHAWPELYFPGAGWLRFEPTPRSDGQAAAPAYTQNVPAPAASTSPTPASSAVSSGDPALNNNQGHHVNAVGATGSTTFAQRVGRWPWGKILVGALVLIALAAAPLVRWWRRRRRWSAATDGRDRAHAGWRELGDDLRDLGLPWTGESDTPRRAAADLLATRRLDDGAARTALLQLSRAEELARYAAGTTAVEGFDPRADVGTVSRALYDSASRRRRLTARFAPRSSFRYLGHRWADLHDNTRDAAAGWAHRTVSSVHTQHPQHPQHPDHTGRGTDDGSGDSR
jgi:transglutaminase-like putative cysteine protease